ncbi:MAG TPA: right-handed parallel beta-helix repeat-containing protein, partial [Kofleriaceae bacterium]|nr:right-handed parallel beta-helix repeat-containing protein [Kofleriaceae bacterium]
RLAPGTYTVPNTASDGLDFGTKSATLVARGATLTRVGANGTLLTVRNGQTLKLVGGTLQGPNSTTDGIKCIENSKLAVHEVTIDDMTQSGIETNLCQLTVARSTLRNSNLGGIDMVSASVVTITNNFVYRNGGPASPIGGMGLKLATGSKVEFNTVADNIADASSAAAAMAAGGIVCEGQGYDAPFNLVYRNVGGIGAQVQVIGTCTFIGSYQQGAPPSENAVGFENPMGATPSYRLTKMSPPDTIRDAFDCKDIDFERDARPSPAANMGGKCDFGADEYRDGQ